MIWWRLFYATFTITWGFACERMNPMIIFNLSYNPFIVHILIIERLLQCPCYSHPPLGPTHPRLPSDSCLHWSLTSCCVLQLTLDCLIWAPIMLCLISAIKHFGLRISPWLLGTCPWTINAWHLCMTKLGMSILWQVHSIAMVLVLVNNKTSGTPCHHNAVYWVSLPAVT